MGGDAPIHETDLPVEFLMNALLLVDGVPVELFSERTGLPLTVLEPALSQARERGLLELDVDRLQPTELGLRFLNDLLPMFML